MIPETEEEFPIDVTTRFKMPELHQGTVIRSSKYSCLTLFQFQLGPIDQALLIIIFCIDTVIAFFASENDPKYHYGQLAAGP